MTALIIIGSLLLLFFLIGQIRVGADFSITDDRILLIATVAGFRVQLIPRKKKKEEAPAEEPAQEQAPPEERPQRRRRARKKKKLFFKIDLHDITEMLSRVAKGIRIFKHGFRLKRLFIHFTAASWDPYVTARLSGYADAFLSVFAPLMENAKHCRDCTVRTEIDFDKPLPELDFGIWITFRLGAAVEMGFYTLFGLLGIFLKIVFRFLWMKWRDPEEYDFRMNQQENPVTFFRRILLEARERKEAGGVIHDFIPAPDENDRSSEGLAAENRAELRKIAEQYAAQNDAVLVDEPNTDSNSAQNTPVGNPDSSSGPEEQIEERTKSDGQHKE